MSAENITTNVPASGKITSPQSGLMDYLTSRVTGWVKGVNSDFTWCQQWPPNAATFSGNSGSNDGFWKRKFIWHISAFM